jgi:hypothetical protein
MFRIVTIERELAAAAEALPANSPAAWAGRCGMSN